jgi:hypothetical protein
MRSLIGILLSLVLIAVLSFMLLGYWAGSTVQRSGDRPAAAPVGTTGTFDMQAARDRAAQVGEKAAVATESIRESVHEAGLTGKIKAKMALDDRVKALAIDVTTVGSTVTLTGRVGSIAEHDRAVALAQETDGVTRVIDNLQIRN